MQANIQSGQRRPKHGAHHHGPHARRQKSRLVIIGIALVAFVLLNALPWIVRLRAQQRGPLEPASPAASTQQILQQQQQPHATALAGPSTASANNKGEHQKPLDDNKKGRKAADAKKPNNNKKAAEVAEPLAEPLNEFIGETDGDSFDLLDSLTAQQLVDGGYTYRSYAEEEVEAASAAAAASAAEDGDDEDDGNSKAKKMGGGKGSANNNKKKKDASSSRSIATHKFSTAKPYDPRRQGRVCEPLAANVSLDALKKETHRIGTAQEYWYTGDIELTPEEALASDSAAAAVMAMRTRRPTKDQLRAGRDGGGGGGTGDSDSDGDDEGGEADDGEDQPRRRRRGAPLIAAEPEPVVKYAYVLMISNHKYVDGALVVAQSLRQHSAMVRSGEADLVLIITEKIKMSSVRLLTRVFTRVKVMYSMSTYAPNSYYKTTFDKIYLFWLTEYKVVLFMDADSLVTGNPDGLILDKEFEGDEAYSAKRYRRGKVHKPTPLTAVGGGDYFQTGLLIAKPDRQLFTDLFLEFRLGAFGYNQWRARDGVLIRTCFMGPHTNIEHPLDRLYHFYGFVKPWFNKDGNYKYGKGDDRLTFSPQYLDWWRRYEELHGRYFATIAAVEQRREDLTSGGRRSTFDSEQVKGGVAAAAVVAAKFSPTYANYVYGWSANYPEKDVPIPGLSLTHPHSREAVAHRKTRGGWSKFDALTIKKDEFPKFFSNASINSAERRMAEGKKEEAEAEMTTFDPAKPHLVTELVSPADYMWIQRFSVGAEYFRPTLKHYATLFNTSVEAVARRFMVAEGLASKQLLEKGPSAPAVAAVVVGEPGDSCDDTCGKEKRRGESGDDGEGAAENEAAVGDGAPPAKVLSLPSGERFANNVRVTHGRCVEEALKATAVNDCFYGHRRSFAPKNDSVVMPHTGLHCDVCVYDFKSEAAPYVLPTTPEIIAKAGRKESDAERRKRLKKKRKREKEAAKAAAAAGDGGAAKEAGGGGGEEPTARVHKQADLDLDEDDEAIVKRFALAEKVRGGQQLHECRVNFLHEKMLAPTCGARREGAARVCVCV